MEISKVKDIIGETEKQQIMLDLCISKAVDLIVTEAKESKEAKETKEAAEKPAEKTTKKAKATKKTEE